MENKTIELQEDEKIVNAYFLGCKRVPKKTEYYVLDLMTFNTNKRAEKNSAYSLLQFFPKMETAPKVVIPVFAKIRCVFADQEEGAKPRFIRFYDLESDLKQLNITATAVED